MTGFQWWDAIVQSFQNPQIEYIVLVLALGVAIVAAMDKATNWIISKING